jgi:RNA polymerase-binding protein DksA
MEMQQQRLFKPQLIDLRKRLINDVTATEQALREDIMTPGGHSASQMHPGDQGAEGLHEQLSIVKNEEQLLAQVEGALERIEDGVFGNCQDCGREIGAGRLDAIPYTPYCIDCARRHDSEPAAGDEI